MDVKILTDPRDVLPFLPKIQQAADEHRGALGFLPASVYEHSAMEGRLWVATKESGKAFLGHLLFGGTYPDIKVIQLFVSPRHQQSGVGSHLIQELVMMGEQRQQGPRERTAPCRSKFLISRPSYLLPAGEALMRLERAYFRKPIGTSLFAKGVPIVFYASGHGPNAGIAVGAARITSTAVLPIEEVTIRYQRQGVLSDEKLRGCADRRGRVHVFTFDNLLPFSNQMSFRRMHQLGTISAANLVTAQELTPEQLEAILREGFSSEEGH